MVGLVDRVVGRLEVPLRAFVKGFGERRWRYATPCHWEYRVVVFSVWW